MKKRVCLFLSFAALLSAGAFAYYKSPAKVVTLTDAKGASVGTATIEQEKKGVEIHLSVSGLAPGEHAIHFHQTASCVAPDFKSAGGHFNPTGMHHGLNNPAGPHAGDMPNFTVAADGTAKTTITDERVTLEPGLPNSLFANGGTALIIHAKADDMMNDPAGNAGDRVACGLIVP
jgi:Cu-Zn family superoxide dismutase